MLLLGVAVAACRSTSTHETAPAPSASVSVADAATVVASAPSPPPDRKDECAAYRAHEGPRRFGYRLPGDPASHPGCTLAEAGDLQCPEDFDGWKPRSKVTVPPAETRALLDEAEAAALAGGCAMCPRPPSSAPPGFDPSHYPATICKGQRCVEVCGSLKNKLHELRLRFASTKTASSAKLEE